MKICLIGSSRFKPLYDEYNRKLTLDGHVVYSIAAISTSYQFVEDRQSRAGRAEPLPQRDKELLDMVHFLKIQESDAVVIVTDVSGYIGDSTRRELIWAQLNGKKIYAATEDVPPAFSSVVSGVSFKYT